MNYFVLSTWSCQQGSAPSTWNILSLRRTSAGSEKMNASTVLLRVFGRSRGNFNGQSRGDQATGICSISLFADVFQEAICCF